MHKLNCYRQRWQWGTKWGNNSTAEPETVWFAHITMQAFCTEWAWKRNCNVKLRDIHILEDKKNQALSIWRYKKAFESQNTKMMMIIIIIIIIAVDLEEQGVDGRIILKQELRKKDERAWTVLVWLRIGSSSGRLWKRWYTFWCHKMLEISALTEKLIGLCSMELAVLTPMTGV